MTSRFPAPWRIVEIVDSPSKMPLGDNWAFSTAEMTQIQQDTPAS